MRFFLKSISCVWRIDLKRFQNDSDSLKVRKLKDKKNSTLFRSDFFFDVFLKVHLKIEENRLGAFPGDFRQFKLLKTWGIVFFALF